MSDREHPDEQVSKSERKRRAHRLQDLGRRLAEQKPDTLTNLGVPAPLVTAIADYQRFSAHGARKRQLQFIGRLMRDLDQAPLVEALDTLDGHSARERYEFHHVEGWRERLLTEPDALTEFVSEHPEVDVQQLRHHVQQVTRATSEERRRTAYRALFRFLRDSTHAA